ncbi:hypothetical protein SDC9_54429 [bioreactor metagenome]|uniref:Uncharacterized protein n=1 Tax=bioreactor metagenome TaxID=1076179 RepID=A0A644WWP3_9ZZZZ
MKKTIAILLVLVIGMVGVFADTAKIDITTSVTPINGIIVTVIDEAITPLISTSTYADFSALATSAFDIATDTPVTVERPTSLNAYSDIGYLHYYSNQAAAFSTTVTAAPLASAAGIITSTIDYRVKVGTDVYNTTAGSMGTVVSLRTGTETTSTIGTKTISVSLDPDDFDSAMVANDYEGIITFTFTAV